MVYVFTDRRDRSDDLMSRYERVLADAPFIVEYAEIAVTNAAITDIDLDFVVL